jgi:hypothetical protein
MFRVDAVAAVLVLAACSRGEEAPMTETPAASDSMTMPMDSSAAMDSTMKMADSTAKKM